MHVGALRPPRHVHAWQPRPLVGLRRVFLPRLEILGGDVVEAAHHEDLAADHGLALGVALAQALGHVLELARLGVPHLAGREVFIDAARYLVNLIRRLLVVLTFSDSARCRIMQNKAIAKIIPHFFSFFFQRYYLRFACYYSCVYSYMMCHYFNNISCGFQKMLVW